MSDTTPGGWPDLLSLQRRTMEDPGYIKKPTACEQMGMQIAMLEAERDRLREALREIRDQEPEREAWAEMELLIGETGHE